MIKALKIRHNLDLTKELLSARKVAEFAIQNRDQLSTKYVRHLGLNSAISNQILRKYGRNKRAKIARSVNLTIPSAKLKLKGNTLWIPCLKASFELPETVNLRQIELSKDYLYVWHQVEEAKQYKPKRHIGVDLNTTGHCAVVAVKETGKVYKLGKKAEHIHQKYQHQRKQLQKKGKYSVVKKIKNRESRIIRDLNHQVSRKIINLALAQKGGVQLEKLQGIRTNRVKSKSFKYALHSWSFYQLSKFIEYKALLAGVPLSYIEPAYTSKCCSRCGLIGERNDKLFKCPNGHVEHADVNAAFNIALISPSIVRLQEDRDSSKRSIDTRQVAPLEA